MELTHFFEAAADDLTRSQRAYDLINKLVSYLYSLSTAGTEISSLPTYVLGPNKEYPGVTSDDLGITDGMFRGILFCFRHDDYPSVQGSAAPTTSGPIRYVIQMDANTSSMSKLAYSVGSTNGRTILHHEMQHVIDYMRIDPNALEMRKLTKLNKAAKSAPPEEQEKILSQKAQLYHNDPLEKNAFFHNMAEPLLSAMRFAQSNPDAIEILDPLPRDFREFFNSQIRKKYGIVKQHWDNVDEAGKRRIISRIHNLFDLYWEMITKIEKAKYSDTTEEVKNV